MQLRGWPFHSEEGGAGIFGRVRLFIFQKIYFGCYAARLFIFSYTANVSIESWWQKIYFLGEWGQIIHVHVFPVQYIYVQKLPAPNPLPPQNQIVVIINPTVLLKCLLQVRTITFYGSKAPVDYHLCNRFLIWNWQFRSFS